MLSIVIPTYHRWDLLHACLASVFRHAAGNFEVIVVDDASPGDRVRQVAARFPVRLERLAKRSGFAVAANTGIRASQGDFIQMLNDDTEVQAGWMAAALAWFGDVGIGAVAPLVLTWPDGDRIDSAGDRYYVGGIAGKRGHGKPLPPEFLQPTAVFGASASTAFYRRAALDKVGLFPEYFGSYFEDVDLAFRLQRAGWRTMFEPRCRVLHRGGASFGRPNRQLLQRQSTNEERVFWRNLPAGWLWRALPRHLAVLAGKAYRRWHEGTLAPFLCGRLRLLTELPDLYRHRRFLHTVATSNDLSAWQIDLTFRRTRYRPRSPEARG